MTPEDREARLWISRFAWAGIVQAVAEMDAEAKERARQNVIVAGLLEDEED